MPFNNATRQVQEPRALDSAERLEKKMVSFGDLKSAKLVNVICQEEIEHVRIGVKWYDDHFPSSQRSSQRLNVGSSDYVKRGVWICFLPSMRRCANM